ncbi:MAG: alpha/beta fold hydrolase [Gemmataceae bacterium]
MQASGRRTIVWLLLGMAAVGGCAAPSRQRLDTPIVVGKVRGVVFTCDGSGSFCGTSESLKEAVLEEGVPLRVETVPWGHGPGRILADQIDLAHAEREGCLLAGQVAALRQSCPHLEIYLIGHSAGCQVALIAAAHLPPNSVHRIVLLAPSVSKDYDLRPALIAARHGIDVFYSERDVLQLGLGVGLIGTADRRWTAAAGRVGFEPQVATAADAVLYQKLRQHPWHPCVAWTGNHGRHYGVYAIPFLRAYVLPLLSTPRANG